jgi:hypothetical protein
MAVTALPLPEVPLAIYFAIAGLRRASGSWREYEIGKQLLKGLPEGEYEEGIKELSKYLCV